MNDKIITPFIPDEVSPYIFISYAHSDRETVFPVIKHLYEQGWHIWYDEGLEIGEDYYGSLKSHIKDCALFLLFASENSANSFFIVNCEIPKALQFEKQIVVINPESGIIPEFPCLKNCIFTDAKHIDTVLEQIPSLTQTAKRKATARTIQKNILIESRECEFEFETCSDGVRITDYNGKSEWVCIPEEYPPMSGAKVVEVSIGTFDIYDKIETVYLPKSLKEIDCSIFLNNRNLKHLHIPPNVKVTNRFNLTKTFENFVVHCSKDSPAHIFFEEFNVNIEFENEAVVQLKPPQKPYCYFSFSSNDCADSFSIYFNAVENGCNCVMNGLSPNSEELVKNCTCFVAIVNRDYVNSYNIEELRMAVNLEKKIAVYQLEDSVLPLDLENLQAVHQLRYDTGTENERNIKLINWLTKNNCRSFFEIPDFEYKATKEGIELVRYTGSSAYVQIEGSYNNLPIIGIGSLCFYRCNSILHVTLPNTIDKIKKRTFCECKNLQSIKIPQSVSVIEKDAFRDCENLKTIELPERIQRIDSGAFRNCEKIKMIKLPKGILKIGTAAFYGCKSLKSLSIPIAIPKADGVYAGWPYLKSIIIPDNEHEISDGAFEGCSQLTSVTFHDNITAIGNNAFKNCTGLEEIILPKNLKTIGTGAFYGCNNIKKIIIDANPQFTLTSFSVWKTATIYCKENSKIHEFCDSHKLSYKIL